MKYKRYEKYKETGIDFIGEIPEHWQVKKLNYITKYVGSGKTPKGGAEIYTDKGVIFLRSQNIHFDNLRLDDVVYITEDINNQMVNTQIEHDDILLNITGASIGRCNIIPYKFPKANVNQHVCIIRAEKSKIEPKLLNRIISSNLIQNQIIMCQNGSSREGLNFPQIRAMKFCIPSNIQEQKEIVDFIDKTTSEIDSLINDKENLIGFLKEQRQAIITETVTKGLDNNVSMKDSGVDWIGEIPEHWDVNRLKHIADIEISNVDKKTVDGEKAVLLCNYTDVYYNNVINSEMEFMKATAKDDQITKFTLKYQDVMITKDSESPLDIGVPAWVEEDLNGVLCGYHMAHIRCRDNVSGKYIYYSMLANGIRDQYYSTANGVTRFGLGKDSIRNSIFFIPNIKEQEEIINFLDRKTIEIDSLISDVKVGIKNLKDYKQSLISEVVTGKIDIREL